MSDESRSPRKPSLASDVLEPELRVGFVASGGLVHVVTKAYNHNVNGNQSGWGSVGYTKCLVSDRDYDAENRRFHRVKWADENVTCLVCLSIQNEWR